MFFFEREKVGFIVFCYSDDSVGTSETISTLSLYLEVILIY